jgi:hypothetical protein
VQDFKPTPFTVTVAESFAVPPVPVHVSVYVCVVVMVEMTCEPFTPFAPLHPPLAVHDVALVLFHLRVEEPPEVTNVGSAVMETVGGGFVVTVTVAVSLADPPAPVQVMV